MSKKQIISRLLQIVVVLIGISFLTFLLTYVSPGDPVRHMLTASGTMPTEELNWREVFWRNWGRPVRKRQI